MNHVQWTREDHAVGFEAGQVAPDMKAIFDILPDAVLLLDPHHGRGGWSIVACNEAACRINGCTRDELLGRPAWHLEAASPSASGWWYDLSQLRRNDSQIMELTHRRGDGTLVTIEASLRVVVLAGREYVLRIDRDISARKQAELNLRRRVMLNRFATTVSQRISDVPPDQAGEGIREALAAIGSFLAADRTHVFLLAPDGQTIGNAYEWCAHGIAARQPGSQSLPVARLPWLTSRIVNQHLIHIPRSGALPPAAVDEQALLDARGAQSLLAVPLTCDGAPAGFVGCEALHAPRAWTNDDLSFLVLVADSISRALDRQQLARVLDANNARYRVLTDHATDVISLHDPGGVCRYCSPAVREVLGYEPEEVVGATPLALIHPDDLDVALSKGKVHDSGAITTTYRIRHKEGHYIWIETSARAVCDLVTGAIREIVAITRDVDARKTYEAHIESLAYYDPLTTLANRRGFHRQAQRTLLGARRQGMKVALLYLDLDGFKQVNDSLGHAAGDELLVQVAARLRQQLRQHDTLARLGGDEFVALLTGLADEEGAALIARRLINQIRQPFEVRGHPIQLGVSIGIARWPHDGSSVEDLLKHADAAMYRAKIQGSSFQFFDPA